MAIAIATWIERKSALAPARTRTRRISSVAYADELMASELKIAQGLRLRQALADLLLVGEGAPEDDRPEPRDQPPGRGQREAGRRLGDQLAGAGVAEVRGVRPLDADAPVRGLPTVQGPPASDQCISICWAGRGLGQWPRRYGTSAMTVCSRPTSSALRRFAVWLYSTRSHRWRVGTSRVSARPDRARRPPINGSLRVQTPCRSRSASRSGRPSARMAVITAAMSYPTRCQVTDRASGSRTR